MVRLAIVGFLTAAVVTLLDNGALWHFTLDPGRRLAMFAYWTLHALLLAALLLWGRSARAAGPHYAGLPSWIGILLFSAVLAGMLFADGAALIQAIFAEQSYIAFVVAIALLLARFLWRLFQSAREPTSIAETQTWSEALKLMAFVPAVVAAWFVFVRLFGVAWTAAELPLNYALFEQDPSTLGWRNPIEQATSGWEVWAFMIVAMSVAIIMWVVVERLFARPQSKTDATN